MIFLSKTNKIIDSGQSWEVKTLKLAETSLTFWCFDVCQKLIFFVFLRKNWCFQCPITLEINDFLCFPNENQRFWIKKIKKINKIILLGDPDCLISCVLPGLGLHSPDSGLLSSKLQAPALKLVCSSVLAPRPHIGSPGSRKEDKELRRLWLPGL